MMAPRGRTTRVNSTIHPRHLEDRECPYCKGVYVNNGAAWSQHRDLCVAYQREMETMTAATTKKQAVRKSQYVLTEGEQQKVVEMVGQGMSFAQMCEPLGKAGDGWYQAIRHSAIAHFGSVEAAKAARQAGKAVTPKPVAVKKPAVKKEVKPDPKPVSRKRKATVKKQPVAV